MSIYGDVLTTAETAVKTLALPGIGANVDVGKLPNVEEELDVLPLLRICPGEENEEVRRADFEGGKFVTYRFDVVAITKGKRLLAASGNSDPNDDLFRQCDWRQAVRDSFFRPQTFGGVRQVSGTQIVPGRPVEPGRLNQNYDYSRITVRVRTKE